MTPRVLLFSQRNLCEVEVWRAGSREFEETIREVDAVQLVAPERGRWFAARSRLSQGVGKRCRIVLNPGVPPVRVSGEYDVFFAICDKPSEVLHVDAVRAWRERCRTSVCVLTELWIKDMPRFRSALAVLSRFDYVFSSFVHTVEPLQRAIPGRCVYLPPAVDALRFAPYPAAVRRSIDVLSIGRRSPRQHEALLALSGAKDVFYVYDTLTGRHTDDLDQHRALVASLVRRSRYFVVNPAKCDAPVERGDQSEGGARYVEGAAAGAIMIGDRPASAPFNAALGWPDAVIPFPSDPAALAAVLRELDADPARCNRIRRANVVQALSRHDWVHRWETVLQTIGLDPLPGLGRRKDRLAQVAKLVDRPAVPA
jgi:hypothetical protein